MEFAWDDTKAERNLAKHGVSFAEASTVFDDRLYLDFYDPDHSEDEQRFIRVGTSDKGRVLVIAYTERNGSVRLISARAATRKERQAYEER